jgi:hypothetical protein
MSTQRAKGCGRSLSRAAASGLRIVNESRQRLSKISDSDNASRQVQSQVTKLGGNDVDIFGLYSAKDLLALLKNQLLLAIVGDQRAKL